MIFLNWLIFYHFSIVNPDLIIAFIIVEILKLYCTIGILSSPFVILARASLLYDFLITTLSSAIPKQLKNGCVQQNTNFPSLFK